jgi:hypothetical protein
MSTRPNLAKLVIAAGSANRSLPWGRRRKGPFRRGAIGRSKQSGVFCSTAPDSRSVIIPSM